jgi:hypothetical protein
MRRKPTYRLGPEQLGRVFAKSPKTPELCHTCLARTGKEVGAECYDTGGHGRLRVGYCRKHKSKAAGQLLWIEKEARHGAPS